MKGCFKLRLKSLQRIHVQSFFRERRTERDALASVVKRQREPATHERHRADAVPEARDVEQRRDVAYAVSSSEHQLRGGSVKSQLGSRHLARAELVLEPVDLDIARPALLVSRLKIEKRETTATRR